MREGEVVLTPLLQANGEYKLRPAILLRQMPPFGDWLVCGVSSQLHREVVGFDDVVDSAHPDFGSTGLKTTSVIRLGFLQVLTAESLAGVLGSISQVRHERLLRRLSAFLRPKLNA